eukprot:366001-Chlamydomonas_euryale.AAC.17
MMQRMGQSVTDADVAAMMSHMGARPGQQISFQQFSAAYFSCSVEPPRASLTPATPSDHPSEALLAFPARLAELRQPSAVDRQAGLPFSAYGPRATANRAEYLAATRIQAAVRGHQSRKRSRGLKQLRAEQQQQRLDMELHRRRQDREQQQSQEALRLETERGQQRQQLAQQQQHHQLRLEQQQHQEQQQLAQQEQVLKQAEVEQVQVQQVQGRLQQDSQHGPLSKQMATPLEIGNMPSSDVALDDDEVGAVAQHFVLRRQVTRSLSRKPGAQAEPSVDATPSASAADAATSARVHVTSAMQGQQSFDDVSSDDEGPPSEQSQLVSPARVHGGAKATSSRSTGDAHSEAGVLGLGSDNDDADVASMNSEQEEAMVMRLVRRHHDSRRTQGHADEPTPHFVDTPPPDDDIF